MKTLAALICIVTSLQAFGQADSAALIGAFKKINGLRFVRSVDLVSDSMPTFHPQGVKIVRGHMYLSTVEGTTVGRGHLNHYRLDSAVDPTRAKPVERINFDPGEDGRMIHAGGFDLAEDNDSVLIPVATYASSGSAKIVRASLSSFGQTTTLFKIADHLGTALQMNGTVFAMNWNSKRAYEFGKANHGPPLALDGDGWHYQDCKRIGANYALCSATKGTLVVTGEIHLIRLNRAAPAKIEIVSALRVGKFKSDGRPGGRRPLTYNAMDFMPRYGRDGTSVVGFRFFFVPHDQTSTRLMIFDSI